MACLDSNDHPGCVIRGECDSISISSSGGGSMRWNCCSGEFIRQKALQAGAAEPNGLGSWSGDKRALRPAPDLGLSSLAIRETTHYFGCIMQTSIGSIGSAMRALFTRVFPKVVDVWCAREGDGPWLTIVFFTALIFICAGCALIGAVPTFVDGHDNFFLLENGWRALHGFRPHLDFWSPWGPVTFLLVALG